MNFSKFESEFPFEIVARDMVDFIMSHNLIVPRNSTSQHISHNIDEQLGQFLKESMKKNWIVMPKWFIENYPEIGE